jgi:hypothetical protein
LRQEHAALPADKHAFMRGRVVNKRARHNLCFADRAQEPEYAAGKGRVIGFGQVPLTRAVRAALQEMFVDRPALLCEGNYYFDHAKCGIGFHGQLSFLCRTILFTLTRKQETQSAKW